MWQWTLKRHWQDPICLVKSCLLVQSGRAMECPGCDRELATLDSTQTLMIRWDSINVTVNPRHWQETLINWLGLSLCRAMEYPGCERSLPHLVLSSIWWADVTIGELQTLTFCLVSLFVKTWSALAVRGSLPHWEKLCSSAKPRRWDLPLCILLFDKHQIYQEYFI